MNETHDVEDLKSCYKDLSSAPIKPSGATSKKKVVKRLLVEALALPPCSLKYFLYSSSCGYCN